jgi:putative acetyltransferase
VIVLGHEHYYPRFGFSSAKASNLTSPFPPEAFMALELKEGALAGVKGKRQTKYRLLKRLRCDS